MTKIIRELSLFAQPVLLLEENYTILEHHYSTTTEPAALIDKTKLYCKSLLAIVISFVQIRLPAWFYFTASCLLAANFFQSKNSSPDRRCCESGGAVLQRFSTRRPLLFPLLDVIFGIFFWLSLFRDSFCCLLDPSKICRTADPTVGSSLSCSCFFCSDL